MNSTQVSVLKQSNHVSFGSLLNSEDSLRLESQITLVLLSDLTDKSLEGELSDEQLSGLLELSDLTESHSTRSEPVRLLDATHVLVAHNNGLTSSPLSKLLTRALASSGLRAVCLVVAMIYKSLVSFKLMNLFFFLLFLKLDGS